MPRSHLIISDDIPFDVLQAELEEISLADRRELAELIEKNIPGKGKQIGNLLLAVDGTPGWKFLNMNEVNIKRVSENDPMVAETLFRLQGIDPSERREALIRVFPHLDGCIRRMTSFCYEHPRQASEPLELSLPSSFSPTGHSHTEFSSPATLLNSSPYKNPFSSPSHSSNLPIPLPSDSGSTADSLTPRVSNQLISVDSRNLRHPGDSDLSQGDVEGEDSVEPFVPESSRFTSHKDSTDRYDEGSGAGATALLTPLGDVGHLTSTLQTSQQQETPSDSEDVCVEVQMPSPDDSVANHLFLEVELLPSSPTFLEEVTAEYPYFVTTEPDSEKVMPTSPHIPNFSCLDLPSAFVSIPKARTLWPVEGGFASPSDETEDFFKRRKFASRRKVKRHSTGTVFLAWPHPMLGIWYLLSSIVT